jgi:S1-C subfamily serine protease
MVERTAPGGPADKAGLRGMRVNPRTGVAEPGDLIVAINGETVDSVEDFERAVRKLKPGEPAKLKIVRKDAEEEVTLTVGGA